MNVVIIGSLGSKEEIEKCKEFFEETGNMVTTPFDFQDGSLLEIQKNYIKRIQEADMVVAVPKRFDAQAAQNVDGYVEGVTFGESTSYEIAFSGALYTPVLYWKMW